MFSFWPLSPIHIECALGGALCPESGFFQQNLRCGSGAQSVSDSAWAGDSHEAEMTEAESSLPVPIQWSIFRYEMQGGRDTAARG